MKLDQRGSTVLTEEECLSHVSRAAAASEIGRIAVNGTHSPHVLPVNFSVVGGGIIIRLGPGWAAFHLDGQAVTFEVDSAAVSRRSGWSVVVEGVARSVPYDDVARLGRSLPTPLVTVPGVRVFEIVPFKVTGRDVEPDVRGEQRDLAAHSTKETTVPTKNLQLSEESVEELLSLLRSTLADMSSEIADTDNVAFRRTLLERRRLLEDIAAALTTDDS